MTVSAHTHTAMKFKDNDLDDFCLYSPAYMPGMSSSQVNNKMVEELPNVETTIYEQNQA